MVQINCPDCNSLVLEKNITRHRNTETCRATKDDMIKTPASRVRPCDICGTVVTSNNMARHKKTKACKAINDSGAQQLSTHFVNSRSSKRSLDESDKEGDEIPHSKKVCVERIETLTYRNATPKPSSANKIESLGEQQPGIIRLVKTAFQQRLITAYLEPNNTTTKDPRLFIAGLARQVVELIEEQLQKCELKVNLVLIVDYNKPHFTDEVRKINFKTTNRVVLTTTDIPRLYNAAMQDVLKEMDDFETKGSGWSLMNVERLELRINRYKPLRGSSYIDLPPELKAKKAAINVKNSNDQKCFLWSVLAALHPAGQRHSERVYKYKQYEHEFNSAFKGIQFPVKLNDVPKFSKRTGISINVYAYKRENISGDTGRKFVIYPLLITDSEMSRHIDLLYMKNGENSHYCLIKNLSRLVRSQITKHLSTIFICKRCLLHFRRNDLLQKHSVYCNAHDAVRIVMPNEGETVHFKSHHRKMRVPFTIYADFESMLTPETLDEKCELEEPYTKRYQVHNAISFCIYVVSADGPAPHPYEFPITYFGIDAADKFVMEIKQVAGTITKLYSSEAAVRIKLTPEDLIKISNSTECHICKVKLAGKRTKKGNDDYPVRDHDHLTGKFRGLAHNSCNLRFRKPKFIPVFIHNLSGYDTHLFIKMVGPDETIDVIPNTEERYISYTIKVKDCISLRFLDSFRFMSSSLDTLSSNLAHDKYRHTSQHFDADKIQLVLRKGVYPYDAMASLDKFEMTSLPSKEDFYNQLNNSNISDVDYKHAQDIWTRFGIKNMKEYTLLYNKTDVLLLADVMENFRDICQSIYDLDPAWYFTAPGLAWDAMLKYTSVKVQLLTDYDMILMLTQGIRGGLAQCSHRFAEANNPYMNERYNELKPTTYLMYWDANNLYGWAQSQPMPFADFQWCDTNIDVTDILDESPTGYILEVDLEYPKNLLELHSDFPLAPEHRAPPGSKHTKLMSTLYDKERYVVHYRSLKLYLSLGMRILKIHRVLSFSQKAWLKPYIDLNTEKRTQAENDFERDFYKLMNNAVFGKTVENIRNRVNVRLATQVKQVERWVAKPNFKGRTIFSESLAAIHMSKTKLFFNKPIYIGMSILDISKSLIYSFHYNVIRKRYGSLAKLLYTDTDSLVYNIETADIYSDISSIIDHLDTDNYSELNKFNIPQVNKKVIGKMKDELNGHIMLQFVGLRAKMYAMDVEGQGPIKKAKGIKNSVVKNEISFDAYKEVLQTSIAQYRSMKMIRSYHHDLYSVEQRKVALSADDDKRFICDDGIKTLPWGHFEIPTTNATTLENSINGDDSE